MSKHEQRSGTQSPPAGAISVDHLAHFVPDPDACREALIALGFAPTPFSLQYHRLQPDAPLSAAGTGNHCVMLHAGYLEFLAPLSETPVATQLRLTMARYVGLHSIVFGSADAEREHARLEREGFAPSPVIGLQRTIASSEGDGIARFSVVRVGPEAMAEGRIQFCQHHSEPLVWQCRWLEHPNGATALRGAFACVEDLDEAAARYSRFMGVRAMAGHGMRRFVTHRGEIELYDRATLTARFGLLVPTVPWIAGCMLTCKDLAVARRSFDAGGLEARELCGGQLLVPGPAAVGGYFLFGDA